MRDAATLSFVDNSVIAVADHNSPKKCLINLTGDICIVPRVAVRVFPAMQGFAPSSSRCGADA
ncbi:hypothetical protein AGR1B_Lc10828 [Agrobacterium fabacearum S56]|nr:hypothetical protein AGR1B_Lc10828 [Agrobacterium fabacearum S56]